MCVKSRRSSPVGIFRLSHHTENHSRKEGKHPYAPNKDAETAERPFRLVVAVCEGVDCPKQVDQHQHYGDRSCQGVCRVVEVVALCDDSHKGGACDVAKKADAEKNDVSAF